MLLSLFERLCQNNWPGHKGPRVGIGGSQRSLGGNLEQGLIERAQMSECDE